MWKSTYVFVLLLHIELYLGHPQYDMGQQISQQVQDSLRGLEHLGSDIQANVQQQLRAAGIGNLGSQISADVERELAPLDNLGAKIEEEVQKSLLPVYAMGIKHDMANGVGGTTVATYNGKIPRSFIIKNGNRSICKGTIKGPQCDGTLEPFKIEIANKEDYCYTSSYAVINDNICLSSGSINIIANNNHITCNSAEGSPIILTRKEFQDLCGDITAAHIVYKYYANSNDPRAIAIPNSNPYVKCRNNEPGVCEFEADNVVSSGSFFSNGNNFSIRGGNVVSSGGSSIIHNSY